MAVYEVGGIHHILHLFFVPDEGGQIINAKYLCKKVSPE